MPFLITVRRRIGIRAVRQLLCSFVVEFQGRDGWDLAADDALHVAVDGSKNNRLIVNSLKAFPAALAAGIVTKMLHTHTTNRSVVRFLFISLLIFIKRGTGLFDCGLGNLISHGAFGAAQSSHS